VHVRRLTPNRGTLPHMVHSRIASALISLACFAGPLVPACAPAQSVGDADASDAAADASTDDIATDTTTCTPGWIEPFQPSPRARFPAGFLWGSATAPYQIEGGLGGTDWAEWERRGRVVRGERADDGPRSFQFVDDDVRILRESEQNAYRVGVEWARVFPTRAAWDRCRNAPVATRASECTAAASVEGLAYYHRVLSLLRAANITAMVTLQHFSLPAYIDDLSQDWHTQAWMRPTIVQDLAIWAEFAAREFGGDVDWWITLNEPFIVMPAGYLYGVHPPGRTAEFSSLAALGLTMIRAHVAMFDAIHANDTTVAVTSGPLMPARAANVSIAHHVRAFFPHNCVSRADRASADRLEGLLNRLFFDAIVRGNVDLDLSGTIEAGEPMNDPAYRGRADYLGVNYYSLTDVQSNNAIPVLRGIPLPDSLDRGLPKTDFGWDIYPRGFVQVLNWAGTYGLPVVVTENGLADAAGVNRPRFIAEHLAAVAVAIQAGVRVLGYFHWSLLDNFEWAAGYCPRFGLYRTDYTSPMRTRTAGPGVDVYRSIIRAGEVTDALLQAQPMYRTPATFCASAPSILGDAGM